MKIAQILYIFIFSLSIGHETTIVFVPLLMGMLVLAKFESQSTFTNLLEPSLSLMLTLTVNRPYRLRQFRQIRFHIHRIRNVKGILDGLLRQRQCKHYQDYQ